MLIKSLILISFFIASIKCYANDFEHVEQYLNSIKTFKADFIQTNEDGTNSGGRFLLSKPGKVKWEYLTPKHILILGRDKKIIYCDYELEEISHAHIKSVVAQFMTKDHLSLSRDINVEKLIQNQGTIRLTVSDNNSKEETNISKLELVFRTNPIQLVQIITFDFNNRQSQISFENIKVNQSIDNNEFVFKNPKFFTSLK